jgi:A/G-specific adenine glycosylase
MVAVNDRITFSAKLVAWYKRDKRDLPWRGSADPYGIWISEVMLQQTTVAAVIPYFERWMTLYPTVTDLAQADEQEVLNAWKGLGYYSRARNIHKAAGIMVRDYQGRVPDDAAALGGLPGFGGYTVGAVLSIAYGQRRAAVDANVRRIVMRLHAIRGVADASLDRRILPLVESLLPESGLSDFNQAFMELGALICTRKPECPRCPVREFCRSCAAGVQDEIPEPRKKRYLDVAMACAVLRRGDEFYISRRTGRGVLSGLWEFPGLEKRAGESGEEAVRRLLQELAPSALLSMRELCVVRHSFTNHRVRVEAYLCEVESSPPLDENRRWVTAPETAGYPMHSGAVKIAAQLAKAAGAR